MNLWVYKIFVSNFHYILIPCIILIIPNFFFLFQNYNWIDSQEYWDHPEMTEADMDQLNAAMAEYMDEEDAEMEEETEPVIELEVITVEDDPGDDPEIVMEIITID